MFFEEPTPFTEIIIADLFLFLFLGYDREYEMQIGMCQFVILSMTGNVRKRPSPSGSYNSDNGRKPKPAETPGPPYS